MREIAVRQVGDDSIGLDKRAGPDNDALEAPRRLGRDPADLGIALERNASEARKVKSAIYLILATTFFASAASIAQDAVGLFEVYEQALLNDPVIRRAEADFLANSEVKRQARSSLLPSLSLTSSASESHTLDPNPPLDPITGQPSDEFSSREFDSETSGLSLSLNQTVFDWGQYLALKQADSRAALRATQRGEEEGLRTAVDVVNAQNAVRLAETRYAAARYDYLLNILRLKQAAGSLTEADIAEIDDWLE